MQPTTKTPPAPVEKPAEPSAANVLEALIFQERQNAVIIEMLKSINSKLTFFVVVLVLAIILQACVTLLTLQ